MPNSAQTKTTGPPRPSIGVSGPARCSSRTRASRAIRSRDRLVSCGRLGRVRGEILELANRVPAVDLPGVRVERAEERGPIRIPRPAIVERDPGERRQLGGQAPRELCRALVRLARAGQRRDVDHAGRAHGSSS